MSRLHRAVAVIGIATLLSACSGSAPIPTAGAGPCSESTAATVVAASVASSTWAPVSARVGDVITWTNADSIPHRVALDDASCGMDGNISGGGTRSLVFSKAGSFPFHCGVHPSMTGTITIT